MKRVLLKLSGEALAGAKHTGFDEPTVTEVAKQVKVLVDEGVEIIGASSDHLIVDVTDCEKEFKTGDRICFRLGYFAVMRAFTSKYVEKIYEKQEIEKEKNESLYKVS